MSCFFPFRRLRVGFVTCALVLGLGGCWDSTDGSGLDRRVFPTRGERSVSMAPWLAGPRGTWPAAPTWELERITTGVPWPRGIAMVDGRLVVLARGRHRRQGGVDPAIVDRAGTLFWVDPKVAEPVVPGQAASLAVSQNAKVLAEPSAPPFQLYDPKSGPPLRDTRMDRPYCTLAFDAASQNLFLCGFSGVDLPFARFRKNASDTIHRFDLRSQAWGLVEARKPDELGESKLSYTVANRFYPHHDPATQPAPHGWLNGANSLCVVGDWLYAAGKDNHRIVAYDLHEVRADPQAGPPASRPVLGSSFLLRHGEGALEVDLYGPSALETRDDWLYIGFRTSCVVIRVPLDASGLPLADAPGELLAVFEPWSSTSRQSADVMDIKFSPKGELHVGCSRKGRIWNLGVPDGSRVLDGRWLSGAKPYISLPDLSGQAKARIGNLTFDSDGGLYVCSGNYDASAGRPGYVGLPGVVYRITQHMLKRWHHTI